MNQLETLLRKVSTLLNDRHQPWALIGGLAISVRTEPRFTRDIDIAMAVSDDQTAEDLVHRLLASGFKVMATVEQDAVHRLATARLLPTKEPSVMLDLLFASSGIEPEICVEAELLEVFPGLTVPVAKIHHLIALKVLARDDRTRPQDVADLRSLITVAQTSDLDAAKQTVRLIEERGFNRSRDLAKALLAVWQEFRPCSSRQGEAP